MPERVRVELGARGYDIVVGDRLLPQAGEYVKPVLASDRVIIVSDETVARFYLHRVTGALEEQGIRCRSVIVAPGEASKSLAAFGELMENLLAQQPDRKTAIIALGGGVVGDLAGFAASVLLRGVDVIQMPTTLLSQVDSSVGGKTGINSTFGKNLIGSFHQPRLVLADVSTLETLPERERRAGYAEIAKIALINDAAFFTWLETNGDRRIAQAIVKSCQAKAAIVAADEKETGARALLNFGHTFGHALEIESGYTLLHGEAVAIGMALAFKMSVKMGLCPKADCDRATHHFKQMGLPVSLPRAWDAEKLMAHITHDKKAEGSQPAFILTRGIGRAYIEKNADLSAVRAVLAEAAAAV